MTTKSCALEPTDSAFLSNARTQLVAQRGKLSKPLLAKRGVVADCGLATIWVKVYCLGALDKFQSKYEGKVRVDAYIDDITLSVTADTEDEVEEAPTRAALDLVDVIEKELQCKVAKEKSVVVSSSDGLAQRLSERLQCVGATPSASATNLGVHYACGEKRGAHAASGTRAARFYKGRARIPRLKRLKFAMGGKKAVRVAASGA